jgi:hypothetical protein
MHLIKGLLEIRIHIVTRVPSLSWVSLRSVDCSWCGTREHRVNVGHLYVVFPFDFPQHLLHHCPNLPRQLLRLLFELKPKRLN